MTAPKIVMPSQIVMRATASLDPAYVDVIVRRWQDFTGQAAMLDGDGRTFAEIAEARHAAH